MPVERRSMGAVPVRAGSRRPGYNLVTDYGLNVDRSAASNSAILASAVADAENNGHALWLPNGTYRINAPIDLRFDYATLIGESALAAFIQDTDNTPVLKVGGKHVRVENLTLGYGTIQDSSDTDANAVECTNLWASELRNLLIYYCGRAFYQPPDEGQNYFFSNLVSTVKVYRPAVSAIHLRPTDIGNTGSQFINVHIDGVLDGNATTCSEPVVYIESSSGMVFDRLNVEWIRPTNSSGLGLGVIKVRDSEVTFRRLYMEGAESAVGGGAWLEALGPVGGSRVMVDGWAIADCHIDNLSVFGVVKINDANTTVTIREFTDTGVTSSGTYYTFMNGDHASGQAVYLTDTEAAPGVDDQLFMTGTAPQIPLIRQYGTIVNASRDGGKWTIYGTAAPTTGTWAVGDRVVNTAPAAAGASEWRCTTAGTPGTWKALTLAA